MLTFLKKYFKFRAVHKTSDRVGNPSESTFFLSGGYVEPKLATLNPDCHFFIEKNAALRGFFFSAAIGTFGFLFFSLRGLR